MLDLLRYEARRAFASTTGSVGGGCGRYVVKGYLSASFSALKAARSTPSVISVAIPNSVGDLRSEPTWTSKLYSFVKSVASLTNCNEPPYAKKESVEVSCGSFNSNTSRHASASLTSAGVKFVAAAEISE